MTRGVAHATGKGAAFLRAQQLPDGGFESFSSPVTHPFQPKLTYLTTFAPALILQAISLAGGRDAEHVRKRLAAWLVGQKSPQWSFNYWAAQAQQRTSLPYPDDLDDTFCALIGLHSYEPAVTDAACLGHVVKLLIATESKVGGPYKTWLAAKDASAEWQDIDLAVNSNIAYFIARVAQPLPNLTALMEKAILSGNLKSPYYPSVYPLAYYLARAYQGPHAGRLADYLLRHRKSGWWRTPLQTALSVSALVNLGQAARCSPAVERLLSSQNDDGSWPAEAFCLDPAIKQQAYFSGSPALTTALALEALTRYSQALTSKPPQKPAEPKNANRMLHARIIGTVRREITGLDEPLRAHGLAVLSEMEHWSESSEVTLLPYLFNNSLLEPLDSSHSTMLMHLSVANLYGWTAYTVYDDFLDNEGRPWQLSVANFAQRSSVAHFAKALPEHEAFQALVTKTFNTIDGANARELEQCRATITDKAVTIGKLPKFTNVINLADRSVGHTLTPLGILNAGGIGPDSPQAILVARAIRHYLAARQLNDDLHDWDSDMRAGILTYVITAILRGLALKPGEHAFEVLLPRMKQQLWHHTIFDICQMIVKQTALARNAAKSSGLLAPTNVITELADAIEASVQETLAEQSKAANFLSAYRGVKQTPIPRARIRLSPKSQSKPPRPSRHPT